ncbi:MAG: universal stress protein, partial [Gammaproteobacteria bacterium]
MKRFEHILLLVNDDAASWAALKRATQLAWRHGARLSAVAFHEPERADEIAPGSWSIDARSLEMNAVIHEQLDKRLEELVRPFRESGYRISTATSIGSSLEVVTDMLREDPFDLLIKGPLEGAGQESPALGSSDRVLLESCPTPVWIEPATSRENLHRVVAAMDPFGDLDSALNQSILELAVSMAKRDGADLEVIAGKQRLVATSRDPARILEGLNPISEISSDKARAESLNQQILDAARHCRPGLVVMGSSNEE